MNIIEVKHLWKGTLSKRYSTKYIVLHHRAGDGDVQSIHKQHINQGYTGIGYHFYIRKDGSIYTGRPINTIGAHCKGANSYSVGVCFEGNFETETMSTAQIKAGQFIISHIKKIYPTVKVVGHRDLMATACPGKRFPFDEIAKGIVETPKALTSANDIAWELTQRVQINDVDGLVKALDKAKKEESPLYWVLYKIVNK